MKLYYSTVSPLLLEILKDLMSRKEFSMFRLLGGTALSLQRGHRISVDIDLFTDAVYNSIDFELIDKHLRQTYAYVDAIDFKEIGMGKSYYVGYNSSNCVKLDLYYTDKFIDEIAVIDNIRLATIEEIIAMKIDVILRTGRKKDFWDINELKDTFTIHQMVEFHKRRHPYSANIKDLKEKLVDFSEADDDFDPLCLRDAHWELIKLDMLELSNEIQVE